MEKQTKINAGAVKTSDCMDVDLEFSTNTTLSWGIHRNGITQQKPGKDSNKRKEKKKFNTFFTILSAITVLEKEEYKNGDMPNTNTN